MGNFIIPFLVLLLTQKLNYSASTAGLLAMGITGIYFFGSLCGGKFSDSIGHKTVMVFGEMTGAAIIFICGFFADEQIIVPVLLFIAYFLFGLALPASNALIAEISTVKNRDAVMSLSYLSYNLGSAIGPVVAGYLFWNYSSWIFLGNGLAALLGGIIVLFKVQAVSSDGIEGNKSELEKAVTGSVWKILLARPRLIVFTVFCAFLWISANQMTLASPLYLSHIFGEEGPKIFGQLMTYACILVVLLTPILMKVSSKKTEIISLAYAGALFFVGYLIVISSPSIPIQFMAWFFLSAGECLA